MAASIESITLFFDNKTMQFDYRAIRRPDAGSLPQLTKTTATERAGGRMHVRAGVLSS